MNRITLALLAGVATLGFVSSTYAADLIVEAPAAPMMAAASGNWDGPFIGVFAGYGWGEADHTAAGGPPGPLPVGGNDMDLSGWLVGVNAGANFTLTDGIVAGVVGDLAWSNIGGEITGGAFDGTTHDINWLGSVRGRLGFDGGAFMPYLTAGLAFANATRHTDLGAGEDVDATHIGWTVGAGVEFAVADNVSLDLQYRYTDYGAQTYDFAGPNDPEVGLTTHAVTLGVNWGF